jgi:hypothetical protein
LRWKYLQNFFTSILYLSEFCHIRGHSSIKKLTSLQNLMVLNNVAVYEKNRENTNSSIVCWHIIFDVCNLSFSGNVVYKERWGHWHKMATDLFYDFVSILVNYITRKRQITNIKNYMSTNNWRICMFVCTTVLYEYMHLLYNYVYNFHSLQNVLKCVTLFSLHFIPCCSSWKKNYEKKCYPC